MALDIITIENQENVAVLKTVANKVEFPLNQHDKDLIKSMKSKLLELGGVGLAAPQVNQPRQIIAVYIPEEAVLLRDNAEIYPMHIMINPFYEPVADTSAHYDFEACYSVSSKAGKVPRFQSIRVSYFDESGSFHQQIENGFYARVLQHEIDHINGVLIIDRLTADCIQGPMDDMLALQRSELSEEKGALFDEIMARKLKT